MKKKILSVFLLCCSFLMLDYCIGTAINIGLNQYFGLNQHSKVLLIGHSHLMLAIDKKELEKQTNTKISKYCREGVNVTDRYEMVKQYIFSKYSDSLKIVLYGVDQFMFTSEGLSKNSYKLFYPFMENSNIDFYIKENTSFYDYYLHKFIHTSRYSDALLNSSIRGWCNNWSNYKFGNLDLSTLNKQIENNEQRKIQFSDDLVSDFERTLQLLTKNKIHVILVNTPIAKPLNDYEPEKYARIINYFKQKDQQSPYITYWDFNPQYSNQYELFFDPIHLNPSGQKKITQEIINKLNHFIDISTQ